MSVSWRHWQCTTRKVLENLINEAGSADQIPGFNDLRDEDQERVKKAFEEGNISEKEGGKNDDDDDDESDKKKKPAIKKSKATAMESKKVGRPKKQKAEEEKAEGKGDANEAGPKTSDEDPAEEKPKKEVKKRKAPSEAKDNAGPTKCGRKKKETVAKAEGSEAIEEGGEKEKMEVPAKKGRPPGKKAAEKATEKTAEKAVKPASKGRGGRKKKVAEEVKKDEIEAEEVEKDKENELDSEEAE
ncbi:hypothetical protein BC938DRAFT_484063 [Jimgerdemannia flammicorona]|uniref:PARP-type domain-containing protein n=1 Tax=Jimgerdemannia flammicorona TaxID=994334 RepID=A0A433QAS7_9FUNG|nr:hypothetical protein BC938DRAFT_484063 [Jimgerdemannia flammicorona]